MHSMMCFVTLASWHYSVQNTVAVAMFAAAKTNHMERVKGFIVFPLMNVMRYLLVYAVNRYKSFPSTKIISTLTSSFSVSVCQTS